jgi:hypothetical protein
VSFATVAGDDARTFGNESMRVREVINVAGKVLLRDAQCGSDQFNLSSYS